jgi:polar amino acid transport system substrate-binding protein
LRAAPLVLALGLLAACGGSSAPVLPGATPQPPASRSPLPVPPGLVNPGALTVAADYHFAPQSYVDPAGHAAGLDIDLAGAIASQVRLKLRVVNIDDPSIVQGLVEEKRRYDMGVNQPHSSAGTSPVLTLGYFSSGQAVLAPAADKKIKTTADLCGLKVGAAPNSEGELALVTLNDRACHDHKVQVMAAPDDVAGARDLAAGKLQALVDDYPATVLLARTTPGTRVVPKHAAAQVDYVFAPGAEALRDAVKAALGRLVKDGTYRRLLDKWGLGEGALPGP